MRYIRQRLHSYLVINGLVRNIAQKNKLLVLSARQ